MPFNADEHIAFRKSPIFKKATEIMELAIAITDAAPDSITDADPEEVAFKTDMLVETKQDMRQFAYTIPGKLAGAAGAGVYDIQMENASLIRRACRELVVSLRALEIAGHLEEDHFNLLRKAVDEFRPLFVEWVATFKDSHHHWDEWGLFNPPGAVPGVD